MPSLEYVTLTTGSTMMSARAAVEDAVIARLIAALHSDAPIAEGWRVRPLPSGPGGCVYDIDIAGAGIVSRCWLCIDQAVSEVMWEAAEPSAPPTVRLWRPRGCPWLAVALLPAFLTLERDDMIALGDAHRCVAWAIIEGAAQ